MPSQFAWIVRMIEGQFPWVTEDWIREAHANSVRLLGDGPIAPLLELYRAKLEGPPRTDFPPWGHGF